MKKKITQKYYDARYDIVFKNTLCTEEGKVILKPILEEILEIKIDRITFLNGNLVKDNIGVKGKVVDLLLEVDGKIINVEVNNGFSKMTRLKNFSYAASYFSNALKTSESYNLIRAFIQLNLTWDKRLDYLKRSYEIVNKENTKEVWTDKLKIIEISMEKLKELFYNKDIEVMLDYKYTIMLALERKDLETYMKGDKIVEQYKKRLDKLNQKEIDNIFAGFMDKEDEDRLIRNTLIEDATEEGFAKGIEKGIEKGLEQGKIEGLEQGKIEGLEEGELNALMKTARNLISKNIDIKVISEVTGLSIKEIKKLK